MNVLDENIIDVERSKLRRWRIPVRQIGHELGRAGMQDAEIVSLLHELAAPTLFTRDRHFNSPKLCHPNYCLVFLDVSKNEAAEFIRRVLRHPQTDTRLKRLGTVVHANHARLAIWRWREKEPMLQNWSEHH